MILKTLILAAAASLAWAAPAAAQQYGNCPNPPDPNSLCEYYHGPGATMMAFCRYEDCFDMNEGVAIRVVASDEGGAFPRTLNAWSQGGTFTGAGGAYPCTVTQQGKKKFPLELPEGRSLCSTEVRFGSQTFFEHFASNPVSGCLGWFECRVPTTP